MIFGISILYFCLIVFLVLFEILAVAVDDFGWSITWLIALTAMLHFSGLIIISTFLNPLAITGYVLVGLLWSVVKWFKYSNDWVKTNEKDLRESKEKFLKDMGYQTYDRSMQEQFYSYLFDNYGIYNQQNTVVHCQKRWSSNIVAKLNIKKFVYWASFWPFSVFGFLLKEPITWIYKFLVTKVMGPVYNWISFSALKNIEKD